MKPRLLLFAALCATAARAQNSTLLDLYRVNGASEIAVTTSLDLGAAVAGDYADVVLRLRTRNATPVSVNQLYVSSPALIFSVENAQLLPAQVSVANPLTFRVRFSPKDPGSFAGLLYVNERSFGLVAASPEDVTVQAQRGAALETITSATTIDFGAVERKQSSVRQFALVNRTQRSLSVLTLAVAGLGYAVEGLQAPFALAPGQTRTFAVRFAPQTAGILRAKLNINNRLFDLEGFATEPPPPGMSFEPITARSGQQITLRIRLSETSRAAGNVRVTLAGLEQDAAVSLLPAGGRSATLALREGATELTTSVQTGTTAGKLTLTAEIGTQKASIELTLAGLAPNISAITAARQGGRIDVRIAGFDNTRTLREAVFRFYDRSGLPIGTAIPANIAESFSRYYGTSNLGGTFAMVASFPVTGDANLVGSVEADLINQEGTTTPNRLAF